MVAAQALAALLAIASPLLVRAQVVPSEPSPGTVSNAGSTCRVTWQADPASKTDWKTMAIQLMSGDNLEMAHITTITSNQDGTKDGAFEYKCPEVTPNSAIYFYQFSSPAVPDHTWTTRFTIASDSGATTPPANAVQPDGDKVPWGVGNLVDASTAVAPPPWVTTDGGSSTSSNSTSSAKPSSTSSLASSTSSKMVPVSSAKALVNSTGTSSATDSSTTNAALNLSPKLWFGAVGAFAFAALL
ncbi:hypothetical protein CPB83DRAFT_864547 [Crepidotus variabilis]|uniref:Yeast cell wall synthesis Kre9/Knh1-like N-terminal domain-containing protein n=1 Tax=Crepidotus variabilis TaxID=179855 RepID=A0A9P6E4E3_9AGAR|nr:hypothetical protein CPB83DRAFT_864547 [Crepidotus variabilis]